MLVAGAALEVVQLELHHPRADTAVEEQATVRAAEVAVAVVDSEVVEIVAADVADAVVHQERLMAPDHHLPLAVTLREDAFSALSMDSQRSCSSIQRYPGI